MKRDSSVDIELLRREQINGILQQSPTNIAANIVVAVISFWGFQSDVLATANHQLIWLLVILAISCFQWIEITRTKHRKFNRREQYRLLHGSLLVALLIGVTWSYFLLISADSNTESQYLMAALVCGLIAGSIASTSIYLPLFFLFSIPFFFMFEYLLLRSEVKNLQFLSILLVVFYAMCSNMAIIFNRRELVSFRLRFEHLDVLSALKKQKRIAESANIAKSKFLAATSHDLRQPLHALSFFIDALKSDPRKGHPLFEKIDASMDSLKGLFDALLDVSRLDAGIIPLNRRHFNAEEILSDLFDHYQALASEKNIELSFRNTRWVLFSDPDLVKRLLGNLIGNAVRYTERGNIRVSLDSRESICVISVEDTGIGISDNEIASIFDEFYQLNNPERDRTKGLGLGLAIVKKLAKLLATEVKVESILNVGSRFEFCLPLGEQDKVELKVGPICYPNKELQQRKILFIDDEVDIRNAMEVSLTLWGCEVICCESKEDALSKIAKLEFNFELIISDLRLRNETGINAINAIFESQNRITPALLVSGDTSKESITRAKKSGFRLLHKPLKPAELRLNLINLLEKK